MALRIAHIASEVVPYSKTGGLADVVGALPFAQAKMGHRVLIVAPAHRATLTDQPPGAAKGELTAMGIPARLLVHRRRGVTIVLIDSPLMFVRPGLYGLADGDYPDNAVRFAFFVRCALLAITRLGGADIVHAHDWQAALAPLLIREDPALRSSFAASRSVLTIHNLAYQGLFPQWAMDACELPRELFTVDCLEYFGQLSMLKGGIVSADAITTVSPTYAAEILTPELGCGLEGVLAARANALVGILNGLDIAFWNPARDPNLPRRYSTRSVTAGKARVRQALAAEAGLRPGARPLAGMVARLAEQKGAALLAAATEKIITRGFDLVILGTGDRACEELLKAAEAAHPGRVRLFRRFDEGLAHRIYAASDIFLMPSRYEPCGLGQMIAMRYGALPVVHRTGGLADTVVDASKPDGTGFVFTRFTAAALLRAIHRAGQLLTNPPRLAEMRARGMAQDFSWEASARSYVELYLRLLSPDRAGV